MANRIGNGSRLAQWTQDWGEKGTSPCQSLTCSLLHQADVHGLGSLQLLQGSPNLIPNKKRHWTPTWGYIGLEPHLNLHSCALLYASLRLSWLRMGGDYDLQPKLNAKTESYILFSDVEGQAPQHDGLALLLFARVAPVVLFTVISIRMMTIIWAIAATPFSPSLCKTVEEISQVM